MGDITSQHNDIPLERESESKQSVYSQNTLRMLLCIKLLLELIKLCDSHTYNINKKVKWL